MSWKWNCENSRTMLCPSPAEIQLTIIVKLCISIACHLVPPPLHKSNYNRNWKDQAVRKEQLTPHEWRCLQACLSFMLQRQYSIRTACNIRVVVSRTIYGDAWALGRLYKTGERAPMHPNQAAFGRHGRHWHSLLLAAYLHISLRCAALHFLEIWTASIVCWRMVDRVLQV